MLIGAWCKFTPALIITWLVTCYSAVEVLVLVLVLVLMLVLVVMVVVVEVLVRRVIVVVVVAMVGLDGSGDLTMRLS